MKVANHSDMEEDEHSNSKEDDEAMPMKPSSVFAREPEYDDFSIKSAYEGEGAPIDHFLTQAEGMKLIQWFYHMASVIGWVNIPKEESWKWVRYVYRSFAFLSPIVTYILYLFMVDLDVAMRVSQYFAILSLILMNIASRLLSIRCHEYMDLLLALEHNAIVDIHLHHKTENHLNSAHPDIFVATRDHPMNASISRLGSMDRPSMVRPLVMKNEIAPGVRPSVEREQDGVPNSEEIIHYYAPVMYSSACFFVVAVIATGTMTSFAFLHDIGRNEVFINLMLGLAGFYCFL